MLIDLAVNGRRQRVDVDPDRTLLRVLREERALTGNKYGCGEGQCGACTVLLGERAVRSCRTPVAKAAATPITTIEGLDAAAACTRCSRRSWKKARCSVATARLG
jgi:aerobic-type carbon monoxide dehydrogenase small subunit (CoxS/CutS family)